MKSKHQLLFVAFLIHTLAAAGLTLEEQPGGGLYAVEQAGNLEDGKLYEFDNIGYNYTVTGLGVNTPPITIACSLKTTTANKELWSETLTIGSNTMRIGLVTGDTPRKIKFFYDYMNNPRDFPCGEIIVPYAELQTHTYIITYDNTDKVWKLYVDGVEKGAAVKKSYTFFYNGDNYNYTHAVGNNITIDDWRLYARILNESEIKAYVKAFPKTPSFRFSPRIIVK